MHLLKECIQVYGFYHVIVCLHKGTLLRVIPTMAFQGIYIYSDVYSDIYLTFYLAFTLTFYLPFFLASILVFYLRSILAFYLTSILTFYLAFSLTFSSGMLSVRVRRGPLRSIALAVEVRQGLL